MSWLNVGDTDKSTHINSPVTNNNNDFFAPILAPVYNVNLDQNDSSIGKSNKQSAEIKADLTSTTETSSGQNTGKKDISPPSVKPSRPSEIIPALGAAATGYLIGYALEMDTKNSMVAAAINGISYVAGGMIAEQIQDNKAEKNQLIGIGAGVALSMGGLFLLGGGDITTSLGISMAGGVGGAAVGYLVQRNG